MLIHWEHVEQCPESSKCYLSVKLWLLCLAALPCPSQSYPPFKVESDTNASTKTNDLPLWIPNCTPYLWTFSSHIMYRGLGWPGVLFLMLHDFQVNDSTKRLLAFTKIDLEHSSPDKAEHFRNGLYSIVPSALVNYQTHCTDYCFYWVIIFGDDSVLEWFDTLSTDY